MASAYAPPLSPPLPPSHVYTFLIGEREIVVYWCSIQEPLHYSGYASRSRVMGLMVPADVVGGIPNGLLCVFYFIFHVSTFLTGDHGARRYHWWHP